MIRKSINGRKNSVGNSGTPKCSKFTLPFAGNRVHEGWKSWICCLPHNFVPSEIMVSSNPSPNEMLSGNKATNKVKDKWMRWFFCPSGFPAPQKFFNFPVNPANRGSTFLQESRMEYFTERRLFQPNRSKHDISEIWIVKFVGVFLIHFVFQFGYSPRKVLLPIFVKLINDILNFHNLYILCYYTQKIHMARNHEVNPWKHDRSFREMR